MAFKDHSGAETTEEPSVEIEYRIKHRKHLYLPYILLGLLC